MSLLNTTALPMQSHLRLKLTPERTAVLGILHTYYQAICDLVSCYQAIYDITSTSRHPMQAGVCTVLVHSTLCCHFGQDDKVQQYA